MLYETTQKCYTNNDFRSNFSSPFEAQLIQKSKSNNQHYKWPTLFFRIVSFDYWNRKDKESYGLMKIPKKPGRYTFQINTWSFINSNPFEQLQQFFLGNSGYFKNITNFKNVSFKYFVCLISLA